MNLEQLDDFMADSNARARRGRLLARQMFGGTLIVLLLAGFLFVAAPNFSNVRFYDPGPIAVVVPAAGILGLIIGLAWMVRILRSDPDPDAKAWRYRRGR